MGANTPWKRVRFSRGGGTSAARRGENQFLVRATGGMGLGTNAPQAQLHVLRTGAGRNAIFQGSADAEVELRSATGGRPLLRLTDINTTRGEIAALGSLMHVQSQSALQLRSGGANPRLHITATGNVGVGTVSPTTRLHVTGTAGTLAMIESENANSEVFLQFRNTGIERATIGAFSDASNTLMARSEGRIQLRTGGNTTRFQLNSLGKLSIARGANDPDAGRAIQVGNSTSNGNGAHLTDTGVWTNASSREFKQGFETVDARLILDRLLELPVTHWSYHGHAEVRHLGPTAEDFRAAFGLGHDDRYIGAVDADGVALAAIQGLNAKLEAGQAQLMAENAELRAEVAVLKAQAEDVAALRAELTHLRELLLPAFAGTQ